ncbi:hypothetical protein MMC22_004479 [Lobaria immixta]|nr:hypothetical protein [Lobaria immixta]
MDALISQVKHEASSVDEVGRQKIIDGLRDLALSIETPEDSIQRIMYLHLQITVVRAGIDLKLYPKLLGRLLRYLGSFGTIKEIGKDIFAATNVTKSLVAPGYEAGIRFCFDFMGPLYQNLPEFLAATKYQNPTDSTKAVFQQAWKTDVATFTWLQQHPKMFDYFNQWMAVQREECLLGFLYTLSRKKRKAGIPRIPSSSMWDIPPTVEKAIPMQDVEVLTPSSTTFATSSTTIRMTRPRVILKNLMGAMRKESLMLIDDMVLSDSNVHWQSTQLDLAMMVGLASMERTKEQWFQLLDSAGLNIMKIDTYIISLQSSIITAVPK